MIGCDIMAIDDTLKIVQETKNNDKPENLKNPKAYIKN